MRFVPLALCSRDKSSTSTEDDEVPLKLLSVRVRAYTEPSSRAKRMPKVPKAPAINCSKLSHWQKTMHLAKGSWTQNSVGAPRPARGPGPGLASSLISCSFWTMAPSLLPNCPKRLGKLPQSLSS